MSNTWFFPSCNDSICLVISIKVQDGFTGEALNKYIT